MSALRRPVHLNRAARAWTAETALSADETSSADKFHSQFPGGPTRLVRADEIARELGIGAVYLKDETNRFGLPSFKILGASWGTFRALVQQLHLPIDADMAIVKQALAARPVTLYAASEGNHGMAVARMASLLSVPAEVHAPADMHKSTVASLEAEGARVVVGKGSYDDAVRTARHAAENNQGLLIQDFSLEGYQDITRWIVDGYRTMMREIDSQLRDTPPNLVVAPVGVGSFAQAVVSHFKRQGSGTAVMTVEPDTAACLYKSLRKNERVEVQTYSTIMAGLDCGSTSPVAWPILHSGVDASLTISDYEAHQAAEYLKTRGVFVGACAAAPLAAIRRLSASDKANLGLDENSAVVLLCTEGPKDYDEPMDVSVDDAVGLTQALIRINSANPSLGPVPGPGETEFARYIAAWLEHRDIETHWIEHTKGRPSVVGVVRGSGNKTNRDVDTVRSLGYGDPLSGEIMGGPYGRRGSDTRCGVAAAMVALAGAKAQNLRGDVGFRDVAEEAMDVGTEQVLGAGWRARGAFVSETSGEAIVHVHEGFVWLQIGAHGFATHGSLPDVGIDAAARAGYYFAELDRYSERLREGRGNLAVAPPGDASKNKDGEETSSYPVFARLY